jgi:hypothetical protein
LQNTRNLIVAYGCGSGFNIDVVAVVRCDDVVLDDWRSSGKVRGDAVDEDATISVATNDGIPTAANGEFGDDARVLFAGVEGDRGNAGLIAAIDYGDARAAGADDGDGLAVEVDVFRVGAGSDQHGVAVVGGIDSGLDGGLVGGNLDRVREGRRDDNTGDQEKAQDALQGGGTVAASHRGTLNKLNRKRVLCGPSGAVESLCSMDALPSSVCDL